MKDIFFIQEQKIIQTLAKFYLPGPDGYGWVPVTIYSTSCPKEQENVILIITFYNALKQQIEEKREKSYTAEETSNHVQCT